ncbi:hypothetical protein V1502_17040 [Bacillus sp. SCS-153A]|uniref:hypothetical protein n=1 Tax=Rossellomorea sedimentorum TaxID=3115294 RepID=UPI0039059444
MGEVIYEKVIRTNRGKYSTLSIQKESEGFKVLLDRFYVGSYVRSESDAIFIDYGTYENLEDAKKVQKEVRYSYRLKEYKEKGIKLISIGVSIIFFITFVIFCYGGLHQLGFREGLLYFGTLIATCIAYPLTDKVTEKIFGKI